MAAADYALTCSARWATIGLLRPRIRTGIALAIAVYIVAAVPAARADIFAVSDRSVSTPGTNTDIVQVDTATLAASLPSGVNTAANEFYPSVSADGTRLVFERQPDPNTTRIILVDLTNGHQADVLNGFDAASMGPVSPSITPDGTGVLIGSSNSTGPVLIDVSSFPSGPFPHTDIAGASHPIEPVATGSTRGSVFAFVSSSGSGPIEYGRIGGSTLKQVPATSQLSLNPAIGSPGGTQTILFNSVNPFGSTADISFCAPISPTSNCQVASLPGGVVNTNGDETRPAFTPDGRYVGFLRTVAGHQRVFVWDSETQTLLDNSGADLGGSPTSPIFSNLSLYEKFVFHGVSLSPRGSVQFNLTLPSLVGIIVRRVVGHQRLFGRTVPKLGPLRRVPLGSFRRGHGHAHWNLRVDGKPLRPGTYQVTVRALTRGQKVRDLSKPRLLRIRGGA